MRIREDEEMPELSTSSEQNPLISRSWIIPDERSSSRGAGPSARSLFEIVAVVLTVLAIGLTTTLLNRGGELHSEWYLQFGVLYALVVAASAALLLSANPATKRVLLVAVILLVGVLAVPLRAYDSLHILLVVLVTLSGFACRSVVTIAAGPVAYVALLILFKDAPLAWHQASETVQAVDIVLASSIGALCALFLVYLQQKLARLAELDRELPRLREVVEELSAANLGYSSFTQLARQQSALEERNRITREIHDGVGYTLTNIIMLSEVSLDACDGTNRELYENINAIRMQAKTGLFDTRRALRELRSTDQGIPRGVEAIRNLVTTYSRSTGIEASTEFLIRRDLLEDSTIFLTVYRFVQEALTNTFRHGHADHVTIRIQQDDRWLIASVMDNGRGAAAVSEGIGLQGMRERIEFLGGELTYNGINGFTVIARVPMQGDEDVHEDTAG